MRGWLTPEAPTGDYACRRFVIPVELLPYVTGALQQLTYPSMWEAFGTLTPEQAADLALTMLNSYTTSEGECDTVAQIGVQELRLTPPYPDTGDTVLCDGSPYFKSDYPDYWQLLVNTGNDAAWEYSDTQFFVPDMIGRFTMGNDTNIGDTGGAVQHEITIAQLPAHTHAEQDPGSVVVQSGVGSVALSDPGLPSQTGSTGSGEPIPTLPPYMSWLCYIRLRGSVPVPTPEIVNRAGEIVPYYGTTLPEYALACDGSTYTKSTYPLLWAALETELVGAAKVFEVNATDFKVPDFRGRTIIGYGQGTGLTNRIDPVANIGAETHQLVIAEMPAHNHSEEGLNVGADSYQGGTNRSAFTIVNQNTGLRGGDGAHNNMQPSRAVRLAIRYA